jgi:crossover junction endodeoxyribonuclease RusA
MSAVVIDLPFPAKALWPNGRAHWAEKARAVKTHRAWACVAAWAAGAPFTDPIVRVSIAVTVHPKTRNPIDRDNCVAALKSYLDGIADALGVDDRTFDTPSISFGEPIKGGLLSLTLTVSPHSRTGA